MPNRPCDVFLQKRHILLSSYGYEPDTTPVEQTAEDGFVIYHYTRETRLRKIDEAGGLYARLPVVRADQIPELDGAYLVEGLLQPWPTWMLNSQYFGDFCLQMMRHYVGDFLLRITLPSDFPGVYVAEMAHNFDCKYQQEYGHSALNLGYDCRTGMEVTLAEVNSYIPVGEYRGGHVLPNIKVTRRGKGIVIPREYISVCDFQPLRQG